MTIVILASEDGRKLSILGVVPAPDCRGLCVIVANGYVFFASVVVRQMLTISQYLRISPQSQSHNFNSLKGCA